MRNTSKCRADGSSSHRGVLAEVLLRVSNAGGGYGGDGQRAGLGAGTGSPSWAASRTMTGGSPSGLQAAPASRDRLRPARRRSAMEPDCGGEKLPAPELGVERSYHSYSSFSSNRGMNRGEVAEDGNPARTADGGGGVPPQPHLPNCILSRPGSFAARNRSLMRLPNNGALPRADAADGCVLEAESGVADVPRRPVSAYTIASHLTVGRGGGSACSSPLPSSPAMSRAASHFDSSFGGGGPVAAVAPARAMSISNRDEFFGPQGGGETA